MPTFDERFARQYRFKLPSEFPLTSPYTGIVHHLSGTNNDAFTQINLWKLWLVDAEESTSLSSLKKEKEKKGWWLGTLKILLSFRLQVFHPSDSHQRWTPWSVFQDGSDECTVTLVQDKQTKIVSKKNSGQIDQRRTCFWWSSTEILTWLFQRQSGKKKTQESYFLCRCVQFFASISVTVSLMFSSQFKWMRNSPELVWKTTSFSCQKKEKHQFNQRPQWR